MIRRKSQGGQALILVAVALPVLLAMVGLAFDVGFLEMMNRTAQTAADSAAIAGAVDLPYGTMTTSAPGCFGGKRLHQRFQQRSGHSQQSAVARSA